VTFYENVLLQKFVFLKVKSVIAVVGFQCRVCCIQHTVFLVILMSLLLFCVTLFFVIIVEFCIAELLNQSTVICRILFDEQLNIFLMCEVKYVMILVVLVVIELVAIGCWRLCLRCIFYSEATLSRPWHVDDSRCQQPAG